ncbi:MAG: hypothetical protein ACTSPS_15875 [Promethearchaeota archaeon]
MSENPTKVEEQINIAAYYISRRNLPYDILCWLLAERQLFTQSNSQYAPDNMIKKRAAKIFFSSPSYDILCWLVAELDVLHGKDTFDKRPKLIL